ncbi:MAG TPA: toll/interleukin-1 receptor domain-containing protein, partial [Ktedonobacterales bacterium]|nr:toll/interleukin-1 receptor domain-containing protein [Ktedonobacterales bacterium]
MSLMRIFVSHSHTDDEFADQLVVELRNAGADVWYDKENLGQAHIRDTVEREMRKRDVFIVVLSPTALESKWVKAEINAALDL